MVRSEERLTTGLSGLDAQLGGGLPAGSVHVLLSEPMNAQELFTYHFSGAGGGHFFSTELDEQEVQDGVKRVGGDTDDLRYIGLPDGSDWTLRLQDGAKRVVLDSFSHYARSIGWDSTQKSMKNLKEYVRRNDAALLLTVCTGLHSEEEITLLKLWADGVMELGFDRQGFGLYPFLKVTKMRGVPDSARFLLFKETERGLFMESTRRVF